MERAAITAELAGSAGAGDSARNVASEWLQGAVAVYAMAQSRSLWRSWFDSPFDQYGWIALLIWVLPLVFPRRRARQRGGALVIAAMAACFLGSVTELHALSFAGLALAMASYQPLNWRTAIWVMGSISWMPVLGWLASRLGPATVWPLRLAMATLVAAFQWFEPAAVPAPRQPRANGRRERP